MTGRFLKQGATLGFVLLTACIAPRKATPTAEVVSPGEGCNYGVAGDVRMQWADQGGGLRSDGKTLPKLYHSYEARGEAAFFQAARKQQSATMLFRPYDDRTSGCLTYRLQPSETMSKELAQKYPQIVSLRGTSGTDDLRLDWDGTVFRGQLLNNGKTWLVEPFQISGQRRYLVFAKDDTPGTKQPFEQPATR